MSKKQTQKVTKKGNIIPFSKALGEKDLFFQGLSVLDVLGQYFYFARRHKKDIPNYREITKYRKAHPESIAERPFDIIPSTQYGWPNELAYKIWTVYEKKLSDTWDVTDGYIHFGDRELARLIGRSGFNDVTSDQFDAAIWQLYDTKIIFWNLSEDGKLKDAPFRLLSHRIRETDIGRGRVVGYTLCAESAWRDFYIKRKMYIAMSWNRISALSPNSHRLARFINQRLASRFAKEGHRNFIFKKDYADICSQWLGGAPARPRIGLIKQHLTTLLSPLVECGLIRSWEAEKNKAGTGFNVIFKPADGFFEDYEKYLPSQRVLDFLGSPKQTNTSHGDVIKLWQHAQEGSVANIVDSGMISKKDW